jgi:hypothetical protein
MREAVYRFAAPFLDRIPDISRQPARRQAAIGVTVSILFHLLILLGLTLAAMVIPEHTELPPVSKQELEIQLVQMPKKADHPVEKKPAVTPYLDPRGLEASKEKPKDAEFESDRNMVAGSQAAPIGLLPLPSQEGRTDIPTNDFANRDVRLGALEPPPANQPPPSPAPATPATAAQASEKTPALPPLYDPNPVAKEKLQAAQHAKPNQPLPEPAKPHATPAPRLKNSMQPREDELAVSKPSENPDTAPITKVQPVPKPVAKADLRATTPAPRYSTASLATPAPLNAPSYNQRFQEQLQRTRVEGNISNRAAPGANAVDTPLGRYTAQVYRAVGSSWNILIEQRKGAVAFGEAKFAFTLASDGHAVNITMESNTSNFSYAALCEEAIRNAPIPKVPDDLIPSLRNGELEFNPDFIYYPGL